MNFSFNASNCDISARGSTIELSVTGADVNHILKEFSHGDLTDAAPIASAVQCYGVQDLLEAIGMEACKDYWGLIEQSESFEC